jgi:hypothetical protein
MPAQGKSEFIVADAVFVLEDPFRLLPDTMRRLIARALWQRQDQIVLDRTDLGQDSNRCAPVREVSPRNSFARL